MRRLLAFLLVCCIATPALAQDDCGNGLPCGPIPFPLPAYPDLQSPTPNSDYVDSSASIPPTPTVTATWTPSPTFTPTPTATPYYDEDDIAGIVATAAAQGTTEPLDAAGNPIGLDSIDLSGNALILAYIKGIDTNVFGPFSPLIIAVMGGFLITIFLAGIKIFVPVIATIIGLVRKVVSLILEFKPF